jgi:hypothetical protein
MSRTDMLRQREAMRRRIRAVVLQRRLAARSIAEADLTAESACEARD